MSHPAAFLLDDEARMRVALRSVREAAGLSQADAARAVGISEATLKRIEGGASPVSAVNLMALLRVCGYCLAAVSVESKTIPDLRRGGAMKDRW